jgi:hypothetical protein
MNDYILGLKYNKKNYKNENDNENYNNKNSNNSNDINKNKSNERKNYNSFKQSLYDLFNIIIPSGIIYSIIFCIIFFV